jgi:choline dehydrogenase
LIIEVPKMSETFDYIIVGGGTAGCVLANRLTADPAIRVLMIEAGGEEINDAVESPSRWNELLLTDLDWAYMGEPQPGLNGRQVYSASGRGIGGTSNVFHMIHTRGRPEDYDDWAANGATGWGFADVLPYLQRLERQLDDTNPTAGKDGMISISNAGDFGNPVSRSFIDACVELGYPEVADFNVTNEGAGWHHVDLAEGKRVGVYAAYYAPIKDRKNLTVVSRAMASRIILQDKRATGVEYRRNGQAYQATASREVLVTAGAIQTPKLLMLSGIGPADHLSSMGITVHHALPGVGQNLHDHPLIIGPIGYLAEPALPPRGNVTEVALFCKSDDSQPVPDLEICLVHRAPFGPKFFESVIKRVQTGEPVANATELVDPHVVLMLPGLVRPLSRGAITLKNADPTAAPAVDCNYFGDPSDLERTVDMIEISRRIFAADAFGAKLGLNELSPGPTVSTREALRDWVIENVGSYYHFVGTAKMGNGPMAVVDTELKVHGIAGLRVCDASVMPTITSANTHTTTVMIAERAADFLLGHA